MITETKFLVITSGLATAAAAAVATGAWIEDFNAVAAGIGAVVIALAAVAGLILNNRSNRKNREQIAQIAADQAEALKSQNAMGQRLDGRLDQLLESSSKISEAIGVKKGLQQAADAAHENAASTTLRDEKIVDAVAAKVSDRIGQAADDAAQATPAKKENQQ